MIRFCYSPDGNYNLQTLPDNSESFLIDKKNQKLRLFNTEDFYFSVLDSSYIDSSNPSVGLSMRGANNLYKEIDLLGETFDSYVIDNDADISAINAHLVKADGSINRTNSSVSDLEFRIGQFNFNKNYIYAVNSSGGDVELDIADAQGNVIVRLDDGHVQTKYFDSSWVLREIDYIEEHAAMNALNDSSKADLDVVDPSGNVVVRLADGHIKTKYFDSSEFNDRVDYLEENMAISGISLSSHSDFDIVDPSGNVILRLNEGHVQTKNFNSVDCSEFDFDKDYPYIISHVFSQRNRSDFDLADSSGNVLVRFVNGHIKTKNFDSENIDPAFMNASITAYIDEKNQEMLSTVLDVIDDITETIDSCKNDVSLYKKEFNTLNSNVSTYKNSVTSLQEDYVSYKVQIETAFTNFRNNVISDNSTFKERFEGYWIECEEVVAAALTDVSTRMDSLERRIWALENPS